MTDAKTVFRPRDLTIGSILERELLNGMKESFTVQRLLDKNFRKTNRAPEWVILSDGVARCARYLSDGARWKLINP